MTASTNSSVCEARKPLLLDTWKIFRLIDLPGTLIKEGGLLSISDFDGQHVITVSGMPVEFEVQDNTLMCDSDDQPYLLVKTRLKGDLIHENVVIKLLKVDSRIGTSTRNAAPPRRSDNTEAEQIMIDFTNSRLSSSINQSSHPAKQHASKPPGLHAGTAHGSDG